MVISTDPESFAELRREIVRLHDSFLMEVQLSVYIR